jgi:PKD repeat protein
MTLLAAGSANGTDFYVSPTGTTSTSSGTGAITTPWALQTALSGPAAVKPGDTIWLRGGTYSGTFSSYLNGTAVAPIIVRQYPGERAIVDGGTANTPVLLTVVGAYTWFWGFEITSSSADRLSTQAGSWPTDLNRPAECIGNAQQPGSGVGLKVINMVVHNCGQGIGIWQDATNAEVYGNLISYNGWNGPDRNHGHGVYSQNTAPSLHTIRDNIMYANWEYGIQVYGESVPLQNHHIDGNIIFWDGAASSGGSGGAMNCGGGSVAATGNQITNNAVYGSQYGGTVDFSRGNDGPVITNNLVGYYGGNGGAFYLDNTTGSPTITGSNVYSGLITPAGYSSSWPSNNWDVWSAQYGGSGTKPSGTWTLVRPNLYESGRGHVAIFNWGHAASVSVDLSSILSIGASYEIHNAQNYFGTPVLTGTYAGGTVSIPMAASSVEVPAGASAPSPTGPEFNAFVVLTAGGGAPPAPPAATFTFNPATPQTNAAVTFTDTSTGSPTGWQWSFGDGGTSTLRNPTHTYAMAGAYTATLTATNALGSSQTTRSVTVTAPPVSSTATRFYTVTPCRAIDTRNANGATGGPALVANGARVFPLAGTCGIPSTAISVSANVTVVGPLAQGQLRIFPGNTTPPSTSAISFRAGRTRGNNGTVALATDGTGTIGVKNDAAGAVQFALDVNGYFR